MNQLLQVKVLIAILVTLAAILVLVRHHEAVVDAQIKAAQDARRPATPEEKKKESEWLIMDDKQVQEYKPK